MLAKVGLLYPMVDGKPLIKPRWEAALRRCGIEPVRIFARDDINVVDQKIAQIDGLLLPGGDSNVHPSHYGQEPKDLNGDEPGLGQYFNEVRDKAAFYLIREAVRLKVPTLAICRGMQEANVALGGYLEQHVHGHDQGYRTGDYEAEVHDITVMPHSLLSSILETQAFEERPVNSIHMQGISLKGLASVFRVDAMAHDGEVIEAVSIPDHPFFLGTQFHAEFKSQSGVNEAILRAFGQSVIHNTLNKKRPPALPAPQVAVA